MVSLFNVDVPSLELVSIELYITDVASLDLCSLDLCIRPLGANIQLKKSCSRRFTWSLFTWFGLTSSIIPVPGTCCSSQSWRTTCHYQQGCFCLPHRSKGPACEGTTGENSLGLNLVWPRLTCVLFLFIVVTHGKELHFSGSTMIKAKVLALSLHFHLFWLSQLHFVFVGIHKAMPKTPEKARLEWPAVTLCLFVYWPCRQVPKLLKLQCPSRTGFQWLDLPKRSCVIFFFHWVMPHEDPLPANWSFSEMVKDTISRKTVVPWLLQSCVVSLAGGADSQGWRWWKLWGSLSLTSSSSFMCIYIYTIFFMALETAPVQTFTWPTFHLRKYSLDWPLTGTSIHLTNLSLDWPLRETSIHLTNLSLDKVFTWLTFDRNKYSFDQTFTWQSIHLTDLSLSRVLTWFNFHLTDLFLDKHPSLDKWQFEKAFTWETFHLIWPLIWINAEVL